MWTIGQVLTCVFILNFNTGVPSWDEKLTEVTCVITEVYQDPALSTAGDVYAIVDCTKSLSNKRNLTMHVNNDPIRLVYKSQEVCH